MGTTPVYHFPYPEAMDAADGPFALETLARAIETEVARIWTDAKNVDYLMSSRPMLRQRRNAAFSLTNATDMVLPMDTTDVNTLGSPRPAAWYLITWGVSFDPHATGHRGNHLRINNTPHLSSVIDPPALGTSTYITTCKGRLLLVYLNPADTVTLAIYQNSGASLAVRTSPQADQAHITIIHVAGPLPVGFPP